MKKILVIKNKNTKKDLVDKLNAISSCNKYSFGSLSEVEIRLDYENIICKVSDLNVFEFDMVYFNSWMGNHEVASSIAHLLDNKKIKYIDTAPGKVKFGGKLIQSTILFLNSFKIPKTVFFTKNIAIDKFAYLEKILNLPFIMKDTKGNKGRGVFLINDEKEYKKSIKKIESINILFQDFINNKFDIRALVIGNRLNTYKRIRTNKNEFRNNISLGAKRENINLPKWLEKKCFTISKLFDRQIAGIDIIYNEESNQYYFIEVNPSPGLLHDNKEVKLKTLDKYFSFLLH